MAALKFPSSHNMVAFLDKPAESDAFEQIVDFLKAHPIKYALTVNPTIYTLCIEQFWTIAKVKTVNGEVQIQALVDKKKVIITETSVRSDLQLEDAEGTECLPNAIIFEQLTLIGAKTTAWNEFSSTMASAGKDFSGRDTPLFPTMIVQAQEQSRRKQRKDTEDPQLSGPTEPVTNDTKNVASVPTHSNDPLLSETTKTNQALEIDSLKRRVNKLEKKKGGSRTHKLKRLYKVGRSARVVSSKDEGLGEQKDASKQGRKLDEIDQDAEVTLVDETQGRYDDNLMFDTGVLDNEQDMAVKKVVTTTNVDSTTTTTVDELTLAHTLIEIKAAKPKAITTAATTTTTAVTKPKARGVVVQEPSEFTTTTSPSQPSQLPQAKDKGKAKMVEPEKPLKKKDQIMFDKEVAQKLQAQLDAELEEEEKLARQREEDANITEWDNVQAMMDADYELATRLTGTEAARRIDY
ncbi:hypothetical protein Tco_0238562 [Tanacetum coccineum]